MNLADRRSVNLQLCAFSLFLVLGSRTMTSEKRKMDLRFLEFAACMQSFLGKPKSATTRSKVD